MSIRDAIYYDLEGPISGLDHAWKVCERFIPNGDRLFTVLSRYDDILALSGREGYEPGDTLMLLVPFLVEAGVTEENLEVVSAEAGLTPGIQQLFKKLQGQGCSVWIISTSYRQHAFSIAERVGIPFSQIYYTDFPLDSFQKLLQKEDFGLVSEVRRATVALYRDNLEGGINDELIKAWLDNFFWEKLPKTRFGETIQDIKVMGGRRKVRALERAIRKNTWQRTWARGKWPIEDPYLKDAFVVVDSITDFRMAQAVEAAGGIALAWNGNQHLIPYATCGVAAVNANAVGPLFQAWREGGRKAVREVVESMPIPGNPKRGPYYHWLAGKGPEFHQEVLTIHQRLRIACRGRETARLG